MLVLLKVFNRTQWSPIFQRNQKSQPWYFDNNLSYVPTQFDWRTKGAISPVQNQGQMGDSASMVATGMYCWIRCIMSKFLFKSWIQNEVGTYSAYYFSSTNMWNICSPFFSKTKDLYDLFVIWQCTWLGKTLMSLSRFV